jgi:hypothetical protein
MEMALIGSALGHTIGTVLQFLALLVGRDRRRATVERRLKVLSLAKEMKAAGVSARQLKRLERRLTDYCAPPGDLLSSRGNA